MNLLIAAKLIHIVSAILFIGCVYFRTFILPRARVVLGNGSFEMMESALAPRSRFIGTINNTLLLLSGLFLAHSYFEPTNILLHVKMTLGLLVIAMFFCAPRIMHRFEGEKKQKIKTIYHHTMFALMGCIILLSQTMFAL